MEKATVKAQLVKKKTEENEYITYVFLILDAEDKARLKTKYIMCVRFPNWEHAKISIGDIGYLAVLEVIAGIDKYFNGINMIPYNYSNIQFIKFIPENSDINKKITLD